MVKVGEFLKGEKLYYSENFINDPIVSVILPTYCRGDNGLLKRSIDSVLKQSYESFELIIVDDGSYDSTQQLVRNYLKNDTRILYIRNECNSGLPAIRVNQGILHARGKYITYQFDDDQWVNDGLELLVDEIRKQSGVALVYGNWDCYHTRDNVRAVHREEFYYDRLVEENFIANNSVIHDKEIMNTLGMYDCHLAMRRLCDWDLWLRFAKIIPFIHLDKLVSLVEIMVDNSLGDTVTFDLTTSRMFFGQERSSNLSSDRIKEYEIDNIDFIFDSHSKAKIYNRHILPWKLHHMELYPNQNIYEPATICKKQRVIIIKLCYDSTVSIMIENFMYLCSDKYQYIYIPETQFQYEDLIEDDILILCRATTQNTFDIVKKIKRKNRNITIIYFIDDDLLNIHKLGNEFSYIKPGSTMYMLIEGMLSLSDRVVAFSEKISTTVREYNHKVSKLNTNVLSKYLSTANEYTEGERFEIVFMGYKARKEELESLQYDLINLLTKYGDKIGFTFLGYIPEMLKSLNSSRIVFESYTSSYYQYINKLTKSNFNLMICPLYDNDFKRGKSPIKLLEACCCNAIGLYSAVSVYDCIEDGVHGYKIKNGDNWFNKIDQIIQTPINVKKEIFNNALSLVKEKFTTEANLNEFNLALKTAKLSNYIQDKSILYVSHSAYLGGAENHLFRHCLIAKKAGLKVIFALPSSAQEKDFALKKMLQDNNIEILFLSYTNFCEVEDIDRNQAIITGKNITSILEKYDIAMIHSCTLIPALGYAARKLNLPYIASLYATESNFLCSNPDYYYLPDFVHSDSVLYTNKWQDKLGCASRCIRSYIPNEFFRTREASSKHTYRIAISGTLQERKQQKELIESIGLLKNELNLELFLFGYDDFYPDYKALCIETAKKYGIQDRIHWKGLVSNIYDILDELKIDIVVCSSVFESFPQVILEAMALEIPVVSTPVAGVPEIIINEKTGFLALGFTAKDISKAIKNCIEHIENQKIHIILKNAKEVLVRECSLENVSSQLFDIYIEGFKTTNNRCSISRSQDSREDHNQGLYSIEKQSKLIESEVLVFSKGIRKKRRYNIYCEENELSKIGILFASEELGASGRITLNLSKKGRLLRSSGLFIESIEYQNWTYFSFQPVYGCGGKVLEVELIFEYINSSGTVGVYEDSRNRTFIYKVFNKLGFPLNGLDTLYTDCRN